MAKDDSDSDPVSPAIAVIGVCVLSGLLLIPAAFIFYGGGAAALGGLMILGALILVQSAVFGIAKLLTGDRKAKQRETTHEHPPQR